MTQNLHRNWLADSKLTRRIWQSLTLALRSLKICPLMAFLWGKCIFFELKKCRGLVFYDIEEWCKIWRKLTCGLENHMRNLANFHQKHLKISKLGLWWDPFIQSRKCKCMSLKFTEELCVMAMENDAKFPREIEFSFKNWHEEFDGFWSNQSKVSKICTLIGSFQPKYMFELKKHRGVIFHDTEEWCEIWRKIDLRFGKWHEEFGKF